MKRFQQFAVQMYHQDCHRDALGGICKNQLPPEKIAAHEQVSSACPGCANMELLHIAPLIHQISDLLPKRWQLQLSLPTGKLTRPVRKWPV